MGAAAEAAGAAGGGAEPRCASQATMSAWPRGNAPTASCAWRQAWGLGKASTSGGCGGMAVEGKGAVGASARVASGEAGPWACASKGDNRARQASRMGHDGPGDIVDYRGTYEEYLASQGIE